MMKPLCDGGYKAPNLAKCLDDISVRFRLPDELIREDRGADAGRLIEEISSLQESDVRSYAARMSSREVETLLLSLFDDRAGRRRERLERLLLLRFSKRIVVLIWALFAYHYKAPVMERLATMAAVYIETNDLDIPQALMLNAAAECRSSSVEVEEALAEEVDRDGGHLNGFFRKYELPGESPLAAAVVKRFLSSCGRKGFTLNEGWALQLIRSGEPVDAILENYIGSLDEHDYILKINLCIIDTMGRPVRPEDWPGISGRCRQKFLRWCFYKELQDYYTGNQVKLRFFSGYLPHVKDARRIAQDEGPGMMVVDFGEFKIIDTAGDGDYSFLCDNADFGRIWGDEGPVAETEKLMGAREYILEDVQDEMTRLSFHAVGTLYAKEMLDILLGLIPDTRASQRLLASKSALRRAGPGLEAL